jgi:hypothetical protein
MELRTRRPVALLLLLWVMNLAIGIGANLAHFAFLASAGNDGLSRVLDLRRVSGRIGALCGIWADCKSFLSAPRCLTASVANIRLEPSRLGLGGCGSQRVARPEVVN